MSEELNKTFESLECWQVCTEIRRTVAEYTDTFPQTEISGLVFEMNRAARAATNKIAEGYGRFNHMENVQFCRQARASIYELIDLVIIGQDEGYITEQQYNDTRAEIDKALALINGYINYLLRAKKQKSSRAENSSYSENY